MKKLIMFVMVLAIAVPALATISDDSPPDWEGSPPRFTFVWQIDNLEYGAPSCVNYDPHVEDPNVYWADAIQKGGIPVGTWDSGAGTFDSSNNFYVNVQVPPGGYAYPNLTLRVQLAHNVDEDDMSLWSTVFETWPDGRKGSIPPRAEAAPSWEEVVEDEPGLLVAEATFKDVDPVIDRVGVLFELEGGLHFIMTGMIFDVIRHYGDAPTTGPGRVICDDTPPLPIIIGLDPNAMLLYEVDETESAFHVSLARSPSSIVTVVVDPNGYGGYNEGGPSDKDIELLAGVGPDNEVTLTFDAGNWNVPQRVLFKALNDTAPEPPGLLETTVITATGSSADPCFNGERSLVVYVMDNDQPDILLTITRAEENNPKNPILVGQSVQLWEERRSNFYTKWRKIGVTLQVPPLGDRPVKLQAEIKQSKAGITYKRGGDNPPLTEVQLNPDFPALPFLETDDPNGLIFTAENFDDPQSIMIWGNDDDMNQSFVYGGGDFPSRNDPSYTPPIDGDQNYYATVVFTVVDGGGDERYWRQEPVLDEWGIPTGEIATIRLEKSIEFLIEDNECGAFGILEMDIGNSDPCAVDRTGKPLPDCHVNIYDVVEMAKRWLACSNPQGTGCVRMPSQ